VVFCGIRLKFPNLMENFPISELPAVGDRMSPCSQRCPVYAR
jgi:hypothetical protein